MRTLRIALVAAAALAAALCSGCSDDSGEPLFGELIVYPYSGNYQHERPGAALADPLVARVRNLYNDSMSGVVVAFSTDVPGAVVGPALAITDEDGLASCTFQLGPGEGTQNVFAAIDGDTAVFTIYADAIACPEESPEPLRPWPAGHVFIATTGSTLKSSAGSVIIDYDPGSRSIAKVLETDDLLEGISFSSRGELFVSSLYEVRKVNDTLLTLDAYIAHSTPTPLALDPNPGGVLAGLWQSGPVKIGCAPSEISLILLPNTFPTLQWETIAINPLTRDCYFVTKSTSLAYTLWRLDWDGRSLAGDQHVLANLLLTNPAEAVGMCVDSSGTAYIVFDGNDNYRRIVSVADDKTVDDDFFDFWAYFSGNAQEAGRWGDIACLGDNLYLIDKRNDRLVTISKSGVWLDEHDDTAFSRPLDESEHYMITASPQ